MNKIYLRVTRWLISLATTLHINGLGALVKASETRLASLARQVDAAAHARAEAVFHHQNLKASEQVAKKDHAATKAAAQAEAAILRRGALVSA